MMPAVLTINTEPGTIAAPGTGALVRVRDSRATDGFADPYERRLADEEFWPDRDAWLEKPFTPPALERALRMIARADAAACVRG
jgi:hypothetical protein